MTLTARRALSALTEIGLDPLVGDHVAWIKTRDFLLQGLARSLGERVVLEFAQHSARRRSSWVLGDAASTPGTSMAWTISSMSRRSELLLELVEFVKLDLLSLGPDGLARQVELLTRFDVKLLAEKVETHDQFQLGLDAGCDLFQGYFFCRPELIRNRAISANGFAVLRLASVLQDPALQLVDLERLISSDVALSYRLLRYINSAYSG